MKSAPEDSAQRSDSDVIVRLLSYCEELRLDSQIMSYCSLNREEFRRYSEHCVEHQLLRLQPIGVKDDPLNAGTLGFVTTPRGLKVLETVDIILEGLGERPRKEDISELFIP